MFQHKMHRNSYFQSNLCKQNSDNYPSSWIQLIIFADLWQLIIFASFRINYRSMPQPKHDRSTFRCQRSKSNNKIKDKHHQKPQRFFLPAHELRSFEQHPSPQRQKQHDCRRCDKLLRRGREREQHFKQIIDIYHQEMDRLKEINDSLREQLESLHQEERSARQEVEELRRALADYHSAKSAVQQSQGVLRRRKESDLCIPPIEKGREPIIIQRFSDKVLSQLESPTFSQLLAGTPQVSQVSPEIDSNEKENALRSEFDRLMGQCESTSNRLKKATLRKQMASIANQLASIEKA